MLKKSRATTFAVLAFLMIMSTLFAACGGTAQVSPSPQPSATEQATAAPTATPAASETGTVNVVDFGANPADDGADDTKAIQDALDAAQKGDTVYFPNGTYNITSIDVKKSEIQLVGESEDGAVLAFGGNEAVDGMLSIEGVTGVAIIKLTITAKLSVHPKVGILAQSSKELAITHVTIRDMQLDTTSEDDFGPHGILFTGNDDWKEGVTKSVISDCTITNIGTNSLWGAGMRIAKGSSGNTIENNTLSDFGRGGILCSDGSEKLIIRNNKVRNCGLWDDPEEEGPHNGEPLGIEVFGGCYSAVVEDNDVDHWISIACDSDYSAVRRNKVGDENALAYSWCQLELAEAGNSVFTDNTVFGGAQTGISMSNSLGDTPVEYALFARNKITDPALFGINIDGQGDSIRNIYFYDNQITDAQADRAHSEWPGYQGVGLALNGCKNITLENCLFDKNERTGVRMMPPDDEIDGIRFINTTISGSSKAFAHNDKDPISAYKGYTSFAFTGGKVEGNGDNSLPAPKNSGNKAPVAIMNAPATAVTGEHIQFSSASHDPDGKIERVLWDFGAGNPMISQRPVFAYDKAGTYTITLVVWDDKGLATRVEGKITVTENTGAEVPGKSLLLSANPKLDKSTGFIADNLALNKPVTCSEGIEEGCGPENAVNGSIGYPEWGSLSKGEMWLAVDLEKECTVSRYVVYNISGAGDPISMNTNAFRIQKSADGKAWEDVDTVKDNDAPIVDKIVQPFTARYVRLFIDVPASDPGETEGRILEFQLFESPEPPKPTAKPEVVIPYPKGLEQTMDELGKASGNVTKAEFARMVSELLGAEAGQVGSGELTREEAAVMLTNAYLQLAKGSLQDMKFSAEVKLSDAGKVDAAALESVKFACINGLIPADASGAANPKGVVTRKAAVKMIQELFQKFVQEEIIF